jgi:putative copper resistance protein D
MNPLLAIARAVHFAAALWLFGELALACILSVGRRPASSDGPGEALRRRLPWIVRASIVIGIASAVAWLAAVAATMSGTPLSQAIEPSTLDTVLLSTLFGRVWVVRVGLALLMLLILWPRSGVRGWRLACGTGVAAAYVGALAWTGHAAAGAGPLRLVQLVCDVGHLLAAAAWLGALPALAYLLAGTRSVEQAASAVRRFSNVAIVCVTALVLSGIGNSWFLVGSVPALFGTPYGMLLLAKLALLALMLSFAAANRLVLTPRLGAGERHAMTALRRNTLFEIGAGLLVLFIVGALGTMVPAAHQSPRWPFAYTLDWSAAQASAAMQWSLGAAALVAIAGFVVAFVGARRRTWPSVAAGLTGMGVSAAASAWILAVPAYPTTFAESPVGYTTAAIVDGRRLFDTHCAACHGSDGRSGGPASAGLGTRPANLVQHAALHRPGDLYWWIAHGRPATAMPAFAAALASDDIWTIVQFLRALSDTDAWVDTGEDELAASRAMPAPDFSFELPGRGQQTLVRADRQRSTLLVVYSVPDSLARLRSLASDRHAFDERQIDVLAVTSSAADARATIAQIPGGESMLADCSPDVAAAYAMFAANHGAAGASRHLEFLIDSNGLIREQWRGLSAQAAIRNDEIFSSAAKEERESPEAPPSHSHHH